MENEISIYVIRRAIHMYLYSLSRWKTIWMTSIITLHCRSFCSSSIQLTRRYRRQKTDLWGISHFWPSHIARFALLGYSATRCSGNFDRPYTAHRYVFDWLLPMIIQLRWEWVSSQICILYAPDEIRYEKSKSDNSLSLVS